MEDIFPPPLVKQENSALTPSVTVTHERQLTSPLKVNQSPPHQLPVVCPQTQEDLWHLPGRLRINPSLWDKEDVDHWLHWAQREYSLRRPEKGRFEMNGRALCLLTKEDFRRRCPSSGDVLYEILQCVKQQRRTVVCEPPKSSGPLHSPVSSHCTQEPQPPRTHSQESVPPVPTETNTPESPSPLRDCTMTPYQQLAPLTQTNGFTVVSALTPNQIQHHSEKETIIQEPLNLSSRERPRSPLQKANGRIPECRLLWDYVYQLLCDERYQEYIRWEDQDSLVFRVVDPNGLARLWGNHKNRDNMTYEKMSRALRHYYKLNIIKKERGQKLLFRFLKTPQAIKKHQNDHVESPEHTLHQDKDYPDSSPAQEFSEDHFEVSPERCSSPQTPLPGAPVR